MKKRIYLFLTLILVSSVFFISCSSENKNESKNKKEENANIKEKNIEASKPEMEEKEVEVPEASKQITEFPWDDDTEVKLAQEQNNTDVLIAGFCTVLEKSTPEERNNINLAAVSVAGTTIDAGQVFSQNAIAGPYTEDKGYEEGSGYIGNKIVKSMGGGVCKVATTLYNTAVLSDLEIVERYNHSMPVPYVPYGQDAAVAFGSKDLKFKNNSGDPVLIWAKLIDNRLYMAFYGKEKGPEVKWEHETVSKTESSTEYKINPELKEGEEKTVVEGMNGQVVESHVIVKDKDGKEVTKDRGKSSYLPMLTIIEKSK